MAVAPTPPNPPSEQIALLRQIAEGIDEILQVLTSFTADGYPLKAQLPSPELLSSLMMSAALIIRDNPRLGPTPEAGEQEALARLGAAQYLSQLAIKQHDAFHQQTCFEQLARRMEE